MRTALIFGFVCLVGLFLQGSVLHGAVPSAPAPDIILTLIVMVGLYTRSVKGVLLAFALGLLADFASGQFLGPNAAGGVIAYLLVGTIARRVYAERGLAVVVIAFACSIVKSLTYLGMLLVYSQISQIGRETFYLVAAEAGLTGIVAPMVHWFLAWSKELPSDSNATGSFTLRGVRISK